MLSRDIGSKNRIERLVKEFKKCHPITLKELKVRAENLNDILPTLPNPRAEEREDRIRNKYEYFKDITADIIVAAQRVLRMEWKGADCYISNII